MANSNGISAILTVLLGYIKSPGTLIVIVILSALATVTANWQIRGSEMRGLAARMERVEKTAVTQEVRAEADRQLVDQLQRLQKSIDVLDAKVDRVNNRIDGLVGRK